LILQNGMHEACFRPADNNYGNCSALTAPMDVSILDFENAQIPKRVDYTMGKSYALKAVELIELYSTLVLFWTRNRLYLAVAAVGCSDRSCSIITLGTRADLCTVV